MYEEVKGKVQFNRLGGFMSGKAREKLLSFVSCATHTKERPSEPFANQGESPHQEQTMLVP